MVAGTNQIVLTSDAEGWLAAIDRPAASEGADLAYDGRSFLSRAIRRAASGLGIFADGFETGNLGCWSFSTEGGAGGGGAGCLLFEQASTTLFYSSDGQLQLLEQRFGAPSFVTWQHVFYLAGRPAAQLEIDGMTSTWTYLTTDHLGTPVLATDSLGGLVWRGGFEPFGADYQAGTPAGSQEHGIFLRLPGQWDDDTWRTASLGAEVYYNVWRWHEYGTGRYTRPDPVGLRGGVNLFAYTSGRPTYQTDPLGREVRTVGCNATQSAAIQLAAQDADAASQTCLPCQYRAKFRNTIRNEVVIECWAFQPDPARPVCAGTTSSGAIMLVTHQMTNEGGCGCLKSQIMHEVLHLIKYEGNVEAKILTRARRCFSCARQP